MRAEDERHAAAVTELRAAEQAAIASGRELELRRARKALSAEDATYRARKSTLGDHRHDRLRKLQAQQQQQEQQQASAPERPASR